METFVNDLRRWTVHPYNEDGNVFDWFLFIGLMVCATFLWSRIIKRLVD